MRKVSLKVRAISELKIPHKKKNLKMSIILIHGPESGFESRFIKIFFVHVMSLSTLPIVCFLHHASSSSTIVRWVMEIITRGYKISLILSIKTL